MRRFSGGLRAASHRACGRPPVVRGHPRAIPIPHAAPHGPPPSRADTLSHQPKPLQTTFLRGNLLELAEIDGYALIGRGRNLKNFPCAYTLFWGHIVNLVFYLRPIRGIVFGRPRTPTNSLEASPKLRITVNPCHFSQIRLHRHLHATEKPAQTHIATASTDHIRRRSSRPSWTSCSRSRSVFGGQACGKRTPRAANVRKTQIFGR